LTTAHLVPLALDYFIDEYRFPEDLRTYTWLGLQAMESPQPDLAAYTTPLNRHVWKSVWNESTTLLFWFETIGTDTFINFSIDGETFDPPVHGDVLAAKEVHGRIENLLDSDIPRVRKEFIR
jgi:hypothetical protein